MNILTLIIVVVLVANVLFGLLVGLIRGWKKAFLRLLTIAGAFVLALLFTPLIMRAFISLGINVVLPNAAEQFDFNIPALVTTLLEAEGTNVGRLALTMINPIIFVFIFGVFWFLSFIPYWILCGVFKRRAERNENGGEQAAPKKKRLFGLLLGVASAFVIFFVFMIPYNGYMSLVLKADKFDVGEVSALELVDDTVDGFLSDLPISGVKVSFKDYKESAFVKIAGIGGFDVACFKYLSSTTVRGHKVSISDELDVWTDLALMLGFKDLGDLGGLLGGGNNDDDDGFGETGLAYISDGDGYEGEPGGESTDIIGMLKNVLDFIDNDPNKVVKQVFKSGLLNVFIDTALDIAGDQALIREIMEMMAEGNAGGGEGSGTPDPEEGGEIAFINDEDGDENGGENGGGFNFNTGEILDFLLDGDFIDDIIAGLKNGGVERELLIVCDLVMLAVPYLDGTGIGGEGFDMWQFLLDIDDLPEQIIEKIWESKIVNTVIDYGLGFLSVDIIRGMLNLDGSADGSSAINDEDPDDGDFLTDLMNALLDPGLFDTLIGNFKEGGLKNELLVICDILRAIAPIMISDAADNPIDPEDPGASASGSGPNFADILGKPDKLKELINIAFELKTLTTIEDWGLDYFDNNSQLIVDMIKAMLSAGTGNNGSDTPDPEEGGEIALINDEDGDGDENGGGFDVNFDFAAILDEVLSAELLDKIIKELKVTGIKAELLVICDILAIIQELDLNDFAQLGPDIFSKLDEEVISNLIDAIIGDAAKEYEGSGTLRVTLPHILPPILNVVIGVMRDGYKVPYVEMTPHDWENEKPVLKTIVRLLASLTDFADIMGGGGSSGEGGEEGGDMIGLIENFFGNDELHIAELLDAMRDSVLIGSIYTALTEFVPEDDEYFIIKYISDMFGGTGVGGDEEGGGGMGNMLVDLIRELFKSNAPEKTDGISPNDNIDFNNMNWSQVFEDIANIVKLIQKVKNFEGLDFSGLDLSDLGKLADLLKDIADLNPDLIKALLDSLIPEDSGIKIPDLTGIDFAKEAEILENLLDYYDKLNDDEYTMTADDFNDIVGSLSDSDFILSVFNSGDISVVAEGENASMIEDAVNALPETVSEETKKNILKLFGLFP